MMLRLLRVEHFRGIDTAEWVIGRRLVGLVGAGDSTKTTLIDAIGLVLSPNYNPQFTDADFYNLELSKDIVIEAVVTELPDNLVKESQLGKDRSGVNSDGSLVHDPVEGAEECLVIRLTVTPDLDPIWEVVRPGSEDARPISASQRRQLGFFRLGERPDYHLRWGRGSALSGLTEGAEGASSVILDAHRGVRRAVFEADPSALHDAAAAAQASAGKFGAGGFGRLRPGLEPGSATSAHTLMLHDGDVPLSSLGLGTRRLTSLSIQDQAMAQGSIIAIDEVEHGLEPHRLAQALHQLKRRTEEAGLQVILTTHSPVAVRSLRATDLVVVHADGAGRTICRPVSEEIENVQGTVRHAPDALLGRRILVGEGATEVGFLRGLIHHWDAERIDDGEPAATAFGTVLVNGAGGTQPTQRAQTFNRLGYPTCMLVDNDDRAVDESVAEAIADGVAVHRWAFGKSLEDEVIGTLGHAGLQRIIDCAVEMRGEESIRDAVRVRLNHGQLAGVVIEEWLTQSGVEVGELRRAIAAAATAKSGAWFKSEDRGEKLASIVVTHSRGLENSHLLQVVEKLKAFVYPSALEPVAAEFSESPAHG